MITHNGFINQQVVDTSLRAILIHKDVEGAISYDKSCISDLLMNRMDLSKLVRMFIFSSLIFRMISFIVCEVLHLRPSDERDGPLQAGAHLHILIAHIQNYLISYSELCYS